jgi:hypothetical protein
MSLSHVAPRGEPTVVSAVTLCLTGTSSLALSFCLSLSPPSLLSLSLSRLPLPPSLCAIVRLSYVVRKGIPNIPNPVVENTGHTDDTCHFPNMIP